MTKLSSMIDKVQQSLDNMLTLEQREAITAGPMACVVAGAGSGKSRVIIERICYLITKGADPASVVAITFTRRAAAELQQRLAKRGVTIGFVGTVHSYLLSLINSTSGRQYAAAPQELFERMLRKALDEAGYPNMSIAFSLQADGFVMRVVAKVRSDLEVQGLVDFDCILQVASTMSFLDSIGKLADKHICVDEMQDSGPQERWFYNNIKPKSLMVVGDENQTLYSFRGADPKSLDKIAVCHNMEVYLLSKNFRCSEEIQKMARSALIGQCPLGEPESPWHTYKAAIEKPWSIEQIASEIFEDPPDVVLAGQNRSVELLTEALTKMGMLVTGRGQVMQEQRQLEAYIRWRANPENDLLLRHVLDLVDSEPCRVVKLQATMELKELSDLVVSGFLPFEPLDALLAQWRSQYREMGLLELAELVGEPQAMNGAALPILTVHAYKGLEASSVVFVDDLGTSDHHRRVRYVAITRARTNLRVYRLAGRGCEQ